MRRLTRLVLAVVGAAGLLLGAGAFVAPASAVQAEYGWWSVAGGPGGIPAAAPGAPTDGLYASNGPTIPGVTGPVPDVAAGQVPPLFTPVAVGALRSAADPTAGASVTLEVSASSTPPQELNGQLQYALLACPISTPDWKPAQNGAFSERPEFDCEGIAAVGEAAADGSTVTWMLSPIFQNPSGSYNVAIVALGGSPYFVSFGPPTDSSVTVEAPEPSDEPSAGDGSGGGFDSSGSSGFEPGVTADTFVGDPSAGSVDAGFPSSALPTDTGGGVVPTDATTAPTDPASGGLAPSAAQRIRPTASVPTADDGWRIVFGALLVVICGGLFWMMGNDARQPRLIGPLQGAPSLPTGGALAVVATDGGVRGVGRHARPRIGSPRRLR